MRGPLFLIGLLGLSACDGIPKFDQARAWLGLGAGDSGATPVTTPDPQEPKDAQADLELLGEMFRTVFLHDPTTSGERRLVIGLTSTLYQGASLEGLYNGLTHSADYRALESSRKPPVTAPGLAAFVELLATLEADSGAPRHFRDSEAQPLASPVEPTYRKLSPESDPTTTPVASPSSVPDFRALSEEYARVFAGASFFTLKRVLGDEALRVVAAQDSTREKLALWYSKWAVQMAGLGVDFGLALRNSTDENFHYKWAKEAAEDRLRWEVLNRVHRVLNRTVPPTAVNPKR